jgi:hypothetical protein
MPGSLLLTNVSAKLKRIEVFALPDSNTDTIILRSGSGRRGGDGPNTWVSVLSWILANSYNVDKKKKLK